MSSSRAANRKVSRTHRHCRGGRRPGASGHQAYAHRTPKTCCPTWRLTSLEKNSSATVAWDSASSIRPAARVLEGEHVPNAEKIYSIFEPHTDLVKRGKVRAPVEFGHKVLLAESTTPV